MSGSVDVKASVMRTNNEPIDPIDDPDVAQYAPRETPSAFIQWKGTDVCLDLHCRCGAHSHFDGYFAYALRCPACGGVFDMPTTVELSPRGTGM